MSLTVTNCENAVVQKRDGYVSQVLQYNSDIAKLQRERLLLEKDLKILDSKISKYQAIVTELLITIAGYEQFMGLTDEKSKNNNINNSKVEFIKNIADSVVAPSNSASGSNDESSVHGGDESSTRKFSQNGFPVPVGDVTSQESDISESGVKTELYQVKSGNSDEYPLLNLLSSNGNDTKIAGRKAKYRLKPQYTGMGIVGAAESYMSQTPGQKYHVNALVEALYDGVNENNVLGVYKTLSTQLLLASKKNKTRIKKHSYKGTYYYS